MSSMKIKVIYGSDMRLYRLNTEEENGKYLALLEFIANRFSLATKYSLYYTDDEGDNVTIASDLEFDDALQMAVEEKRKSLKIFVKSVAEVAVTVETVAEDEEMQDFKMEDGSTHGSNEQQQPSKDDAEKICNFLRDDAISALIPELIRRMIIDLKAEQMKMNTAGVSTDIESNINNNSAGTVDIKMVLQKVLSDDCFSPIVNHPSFAEIEALVLPRFLNKLPQYLPYLMFVSEDQISLWTETIIGALRNFDIIDMFIDGSGNGSGCSFGGNGSSFMTPMMLHMVNGGLMANNNPLFSNNYKGNHWRHNHRHGRGGRGRFRGRGNWHGYGHRLGGHDHRHHHRHQQQHPTQPMTGPNSMLMAAVCKSVSLRDGTCYPLDTILSKVWKLKNVGPIVWGNNVQLVYVSGEESMLIEKRFPIIAGVKPGETCEATALIKTPMVPGRYQIYFRLQRTGDFFGPHLWIDIYAVDENGIETINIPIAEQQSINQQMTDYTSNSNGNGSGNGGRYKKKIAIQKVLDAKFLNKEQKREMKLKKETAKIEAKQMKLQARNMHLESQLVNERISIGEGIDENRNGNGRVFKKSKKNIQKLEKKSFKLNKRMMKMEQKMKSLEMKRLAFAAEIQNDNENSHEEQEFMIIDNGSSDDDEVEEEVPMQAMANVALVIDGENEVKEDIADVEVADDVEEEENEFLYASELEVILNMGIADEEVARVLLVQHKGQIDRCIQDIFG